MVRGRFSASCVPDEGFAGTVRYDSMRARTCKTGSIIPAVSTFCSPGPRYEPVVSVVVNEVLLVQGG